MKLLTTRPSSIFIRGPYVLKILAMRISINIRETMSAILLPRKTRFHMEKVNTFTYPMLPMIVKHQCLSHTLPLVIAAPNPCCTKEDELDFKTMQQFNEHAYIIFSSKLQRASVERKSYLNWTVKMQEKSAWSMTEHTNWIDIAPVALRLRMHKWITIYL